MNEGIGSADWRVPAELHEDGISGEHLRVRHALHTLPRCCGKAGFEFRLHQRLEGGFVAMGRDSGPRWSIGWAGLGLGVATAAAIAIFAFDFTGGNPALKTGQIATIPARIESSQPVTTNAVPQTVSQPQQEQITRHVVTTPTEQVAENKDKVIDAKQDSLDKLKSKSNLEFPQAQAASQQQPPPR